MDECMHDVGAFGITLCVHCFSLHAPHSDADADL